MEQIQAHNELFRLGLVRKDYALNGGAVLLLHHPDIRFRNAGKIPFLFKPLSTLIPLNAS